MKNEKLLTLEKKLEQIWGPLNANLALASRTLLEELLANSSEDKWLKNLIKENKPETVLFRNEKYGFILSSHVEHIADISPPHDHGNGWVIYCTAIGNTRMGIFHRVEDSEGTLRAVQKNEYDLGQGQCSIYFPGDIHDTTTTVNNTLMLRLTSCDFHKEVKEGRLIRFKNFEKWNKSPKGTNSVF